MLSPFQGGRFGALAPGGTANGASRNGSDGRAAPAMDPGTRALSGTQSNGRAQQDTDAGVRIEKHATYVLQAGDVVRGRASVDSEDRVIVVANGRVVLVHPGGLLQPALTSPATRAMALGGGVPPDADAKKRKLALIAGLTLSGVAMVGSIVAGVVADKASKKDAWDPSVDMADGDGAPLWGNDEAGD